MAVVKNSLVGKSQGERGGGRDIGKWTTIMLCLDVCGRWNKNALRNKNLFGYLEMLPNEILPLYRITIHQRRIT